MNDVLIASFGRSVHCSIKRGLISSQAKALKMVHEWMSGLPLNNESSLNANQVELIIDLFFFFGRYLFLVTYLDNKGWFDDSEKYLNNFQNYFVLNESMIGPLIWKQLENIMEKYDQGNPE